jgi:hypothetical protein
MARLGPMPAPTLGVTATLALLWLVAAVQAGPAGPAAAALDPGRAGSIGEWWGIAQLAVALALAAAMPATRILALAPAALMAGEVGEVHLHTAHMLAAGAGSGSGLPWLKAIASDAETC